MNSKTLICIELKILHTNFTAFFDLTMKMIDWKIKFNLYNINEIKNIFYNKLKP